MLLLTLVIALSTPYASAALSVQDVVAAVTSPENLQQYRFELMGLSFILLYLLSYLRGAGAIKQQARAWVRWAGTWDAAVPHSNSAAVHSCH